MSHKGKKTSSWHGGIVLLSLALSACSNASSVPVLGAFFPDWLFCILGAALLVLIINKLLARLGYSAWLAPPALFYPMLTALFALSAWLLFFQS
ncbi:YtcA family lipoprotein [Pseudomonas sp. CLCA07]